MNTRRLQKLVDRLLATSRQRFGLGLVSWIAVVGTELGLAQSTSFRDGWVVVVVGLLAAVVAFEPDEHLGALVMVIVAVHWLAANAPPTSGWTLLVAAALLVFHAVIALMAVTPHTSVLSGAVLTRWLGRTAMVATSAVGTWLIVLAFERGDPAGSVPLSVAALAVLAAAVIAFRSGTITPTRPSPQRSVSDDSQK